VLPDDTQHSDFELAIPAGKRPQTHALDRAATGTGISRLKILNK